MYRASVYGSTKIEVLGGELAALGALLNQEALLIAGLCSASLATMGQFRVAQWSVQRPVKMLGLLVSDSDDRPCDTWQKNGFSPEGGHRKWYSAVAGEEGEDGEG
ncbi:hypothetical protein DFP72DRAFT_849713 [Ephemerocybe angulata]|uniref:Uncharacterized protein n=1 Tax=Ephemerocybe angulata TaxID=980116 RepID=A0A8H6HSV3_9AGAR|nr:hypothetical protein DFP72DRAFT_849713 [Tulosesus angulatus]